MRIRRSNDLLKDDDILLISKISDAFSHPLRLKILQYIMTQNAGLKPVCNKDIVEEFNYAQSTISQHMSILVRSGLLQVERKNKFSYYFVHTGNYNNYVNAMTRFIQQKANAIK